MKFCNLRVEARASLPGFRRQTIVSNWYPQSSLCPRSLLELYGTSSVIFRMRLFSYHAVTTAAEEEGFSTNWTKEMTQPNYQRLIVFFPAVKWCEKMQYPSKLWQTHTHYSTPSHLTTTYSLNHQTSLPKKHNSLPSNLTSKTQLPSIKNLTSITRSSRQRPKTTSQSHIPRGKHCFSPKNSSETKPANPNLQNARVGSFYRWTMRERRDKYGRIEIEELARKAGLQTV